MADKKHFGTSLVTGLNSQTAPHLLRDDMLTLAMNVSYAETGAIQGEKNDTLLLSASSPCGLGAATVDGSTEYIFKDGATVKTADAAVLAGWNASSVLRVVQANNEAVLYDGNRAVVWDGDVVRKLGTMVGTQEYDDDEPGATGPRAGVKVREAAFVNITAITELAGVVTVQTSLAHTLSGGEKVYITGVLGMTEINDRHYTVSVVDEDEFTLDEVDGSTWTTYDSGGAVYFDGSGLDGEYRYRVSYTVTLPNAKVIESSPAPLLDFPFGEVEATGEFSTITPTDKVSIQINSILPADAAAYILEDFANAVGTDYTFGIRVWRTKEGGVTPYLLREFSHASSYDLGDGIAFYDQTLDVALGAAWLDGLDGAADSHDDPPAASEFVPFAGRLYAFIGNKAYPSMVGNYDYFADGFYWDRDVPIVGAAVTDDRMMVFGSGRAWVHRNPDGIGFWDDAILPAYPAAQSAIVETAAGALFATDKGLYSWDGGTPQRISGPVQDDWETASTGQWFGAYAGDEVVFCGPDTTFSIKTDEAGPHWRTLVPATAYRKFAASRDDGLILAERAAGFYSLSTAGSRRTMTITSKEYFTGPCANVQAVVDLESGASYAATLTSNMGISGNATFANAESSRRRVRASFAHMTGEFWHIAFSGTGKIYGWSLEGAVTDGLK